jgi:enamine deaminase RidA (YjgF/YER057c/UK114 family)
MKIIRPDGWPRPRGYAHAIAAAGTTVFISGQVGWDETGAFTATNLPGQVRRALENVVAILAEAGGRPEHVARMTWYVIDKRDYVANAAAIGAAYRAVMGKHYPAMSVVEVSALLEDQALVEIEATAVVP